MAQNAMVAFIAKTVAGAFTSLSLDADGNLKTASEKTAGTGYVTAPAGATTALGTGAAGDVLASVTIVPGVAAAGAVGLKDGTGATISLFAGGATTALPSLMPVTIPLNAVSTGGGWSIVCGADVTVIATGQFTA